MRLKLADDRTISVQSVLTSRPFQDAVLTGVVLFVQDSAAHLNLDEARQIGTALIEAATPR